jgi:nucleoside-diphosphate-sugar epimerase
LNNKIGILGCGWLGFPLAKALIKERYIVRGSTTTPLKLEVLSEAGIDPFLISLAESGTSGDLDAFITGLNTLIINIPPNLRGSQKENYTSKIQHLGHVLQNTTLKNIIFISSTSVYGDIQGSVTEDTLPEPNTESGRQLLAAERILREIPNLNTTIIRFGGLIGPNRHPIIHLAGRKDLHNGDERINLIHLDDCIGLIKTVLMKNYGNITINGTFPYHPTKKEYYTSEALKKGLFPPSYLSIPTEKDHKTIENARNTVKIYQYKTTIIS